MKIKSLIYRKRKGAVAAPLVMGIGGAWLGGVIGTAMQMGTMGMMFMSSFGFIAGSYLGNMLFPMKHKVGSPKLHNYPLQQVSKGIPVPIICGTEKVAGNIIYKGPITSYTIKHSSGGGKGGGKGGGEVEFEETRYRCSFLIGVCEGVSTVKRMWEGKDEINNGTDINIEAILAAFLQEKKGLGSGDLQNITIFDGENNDGLEALIGKDFSRHKNTCCVFFQHYELGNSPTIPNFSFEVTALPYDFRVLFMYGGYSHQYKLIYDMEGIYLDAGPAVDYGEIDDPPNNTIGIPCKLHPFNDTQAITCIGTTWYDQKNDVQSKTSINEIVIHKTNFNAETFDGTEKVHGMSPHGASGPKTIGGRGVFAPDGYFYVPCYYTATNLTCVARLTINGVWDDSWIPAPSPSWAGSAGMCVNVTADGLHIILKTLGRLYKIRLSDAAIIWNVVHGGTDTAMAALDNEDRSYVGRSASNDIRLFDGNGNFLGTINDTQNCTQDLICRNGYVIGCKERYDVGGTEETRANMYIFEAGSDLSPEITYVQFTDDGDNPYFAEVYGDYIYVTYQRGSTNYNIAKISFGGSVIARANVEDDIVGHYIRWDEKICVIRDWYTYHDDDDTIAVFDKNLNFIEDLQNIGQATSSSGLMWQKAQAIAVPAVISQQDENCAAIIKRLMLHPRYGGGMSEDKINEDAYWETYTYCELYNLKISLSINEIRSIKDWIDYICSHFDGFCFWEAGQLYIKAYKDEDGVFNLTQDDLVVEGNSPPVQARKRKYSETVNRVEVVWTNRAKGYDFSVAVANDEVDQRVSGQTRKATLNLHGIHNAAYAQKLAYRYLINSMYRFTFYKFKVGYKYMLLQIGDVGTISDGHLITDQKIRIANISESKDGKNIEIEAVEDISELYPSIAFSTQETVHEEDAAPTLANSQVCFREDIYEKYVYLSIVPSTIYCNGWYVFKSYDDVSYELVGKATIEQVTDGSANSYGLLTTALKGGSEVAWRGEETFEVNIGTITDLDTGISDEQFFSNKRLAKIGDEIIAYKTCEETAVEGIWKITGVIRGLYNTPVVAHAIGDTFCTLNTDFTYIYTEKDIGKTLYFKVLPYYGKVPLDMNLAVAYSHVIQGLYARPQPVSLMRNDDNEGFEDYDASFVTLAWQFASKHSGWNVGPFDYSGTPWNWGDSESLLVNQGGVLYGSYNLDADISQVKIRIEEADGTLINEKIFDKSESEFTNEQIVLTYTDVGDFNSKDPVRVKVIPITNLQSVVEKELLFDKIGV